MKKYMMMVLAVAAITACEKADIPDNSVKNLSLLSRQNEEVHVHGEG